MRTSTEIRLDINNTPGHLRLILLRAEAARTMVKNTAELTVGQLAAQKGGEDLWNADNSRGNVISYADSQTGHRLAAVRAILDVLEADESYAEAQAKLDPLHAELKEALDAEAEASRKHLEAKNAVAAAEQEARDELAAKVEKDPRVLKARKALAGIKRLGEPLETAIAN